MRIRMLVLALCCSAVNAWAADASSTLNSTDTTIVSSGNLVNAPATTASVAVTGGAAQAELPLTTNAVSPPSPGIYGPLGKTPGAASIPFISAVEEIAEIEYGAPPKPLLIEDTQSGQTRLVFNPFPAYFARQGSSVRIERMKPPSLRAKLYKRVIPLGTITVFTKDDAGAKTDWAIVKGDVMKYLWDSLRGYRTVSSAGLIHAVSAASGVETAGWSASVGLAIGHIINALSSLGVAPTGTMGAGKTNPTSFPGGTLVIFAEEESEGMDFNMVAVEMFFAPVEIQPRLVKQP